MTLIIGILYLIFDTTILLHLLIMHLVNRFYNDFVNNLSWAISVADINIINFVLINYILKDHSNYFGLIVICLVSLLKHWCNSSMLSNIREFPVFHSIVEDNCQSVKVYMSPVFDKSHGNIFERIAFIFRLFEDFQSFFFLKNFTKRESFSVGYPWVMLFTDVFKHFEFFLELYFFKFKTFC